MKCLLVSRIDLPEALDCARQMMAVLEEEDHTVILDTDIASALGRTGQSLNQADADIAVVIGGDGTILRTVQQMHEQIPVIGINHGEVGFLADLEPAQARKFARSLAPGLDIEERMRLALLQDGKILGDALNEALIVTTRPAKMLRFSILVDGVVTEQFRSDGLLVSTPTGSTAYAMSAGGPIVDPRIEAFLLVPLAPYLLSSRPHVISSCRKLEIRLESSKPAKLVLDGQKTVELGSSASLVVQRAREPARFVNVHRNFFEKVDNKLRKL
ncbi:NAD(+)/NADH kinase [Methanoregula sp.]|uniref:NAD(+)/NADH kinase n=1 Tax=Methanoregula sp. TaxID=2052170 RepID=UPI002D104A55|nr:NAD(+)/NADH kinase [Methanoregula sp.]HVP96172.1 NAD(+)/NADH kinase [Methanoregula sp.]